jgi:hypothetical protein
MGQLGSDAKIVAAHLTAALVGDLSARSAAEQAKEAAATYFKVLEALRELDEKTPVPKGSQSSVGRQAMT